MSWNTIYDVIVSAHIVGRALSPAVRLEGVLVEDPPARGTYLLNCASSPGDPPTFNLSVTGTQDTSQIYWLPWGKGNASLAISLLQASPASLFLTSGMSGCFFVGCNGLVTHTAAGTDGGGQAALDSAWREMTEWGEDMNQDTTARYALAPYLNRGCNHVTAVYGAEAKISIAVVMGCRAPNEPNNWLFAYQELTIGSPDFCYWKPLIPQI